MADFDSERWRENGRFEGGTCVSPILACCMIVDTGLPGWFAATGLGVMVEQPESRGIPDFFAAIYRSSR